MAGSYLLEACGCPQNGCICGTGIMPQAVITRMQRTQIAHMPDTAVLMQKRRGAVDCAGVEDNDFYPVREFCAGLSYTSGTSSATPKTAEQQALNSTDGTVSMPKLRVPHDLLGQIRPQDRIEITHRWQRKITPLLFEVFGDGEAGPSAVVYRLRMVTR